MDFNKILFWKATLTSWQGGKGCLLVAGTEGEIQIPHLGPLTLQWGRDNLLVLGGVRSSLSQSAWSHSWGYKEAL